MPFSKNQIKIIIACSVFAVLLLLASLFTDTDNTARQPNSDFIPESAPAALNRSEELYTILGAARFNQVRQDLNDNARSYYKVPQNQQTTYAISDIKKVNDTTVEFTATYTQEPKHSIRAKVVFLANERMTLTFTDTKTNDSSMSSNLSSNNKRNAFIASLPIERSLYRIEFDAVGNSFMVMLFERSKAALDAANAELAAALGSIQNEKIGYTSPSLWNDTL